MKVDYCNICKKNVYLVQNEVPKYSRVAIIRDAHFTFSIAGGVKGAC